jgi:hypothetical protein
MGPTGLCPGKKKSLGTATALPYLGMQDIASHLPAEGFSQGQIVNRETHRRLLPTRNQFNLCLDLGKRPQYDRRKS